jgi:hypothetical protein
MKKLIGVLLREALETHHSIKRFKNRFGKLNNGDITNEEKTRIIKNLESVKNYDFPNDESFSILLGDFNVKRNNKNRHRDVSVVQYYDKVEKKNMMYYSVKDRSDISVGNQIWLIIRQNEIVTIMFRRSSQDGSEKHLMDSFKVDKIIRVKNFSKYKGDVEVNPPIKKRKFKKIKIEGYGEVKYYEDRNEFITKAGTKLDIYDIFDKLPDNIKNKILDKI